MGSIVSDFGGGTTDSIRNPSNENVLEHSDFYTNLHKLPKPGLELREKPIISKSVSKILKYSTRRFGKKSLVKIVGAIFEWLD